MIRSSVGPIQAEMLSLLGVGPPQAFACRVIDAIVSHDALLAARGHSGKDIAMPRLIENPTRVPAAGTRPKLIDEYVGRVNTGDDRVSIAHMRSPGGWAEPGQTPEFDEYTVVLKGQLQVAHRGGLIEVCAGQAVLVRQGEWVRYSTPGEDGAEYIAICLPAFSPQTVHRDV